MIDPETQLQLAVYIIVKKLGRDNALRIDDILDLPTPKDQVFSFDIGWSKDEDALILELIEGTEEVNAAVERRKAQAHGDTGEQDNS